MSLSHDDTAESPVPAKVALKAEYSKTVSFARQQAGIPVFYRMVITNISDEVLRNITVEIATDPTFAPSIFIPLADLLPKAQVVLDERALDFVLSTDYLASQREQIKGSFFVVVKAEDWEFSESFPITILAYNEWSGLDDLPELLAAYVTPNQPAIAQLLLLVSDHLDATTGRSALDGYQSADRRRVYRMIEGLFRALHAKNLFYSVPPASYEECGQKVRFAENVIDSQTGTCLDLSLLFASALEQMGLNPLLMLEQGHAYVGCWLEPGGLELPTTDDLEQLQKLTDGADAQVLIWEATLVTEKQGSLNEAEQHARKRLNTSTTLRLAIDIVRARANRIKPLSVKILEGRLMLEVHERAATHEIPTTSDEDLNRRFLQHSRGTAPVDEVPKDRVKYWSDQLLDLSLRNHLLNFNTENNLRIQTHSLAELEDQLASQAEFSLLPRVDADPRSASLHQKRHGEDLSQQQMASDLASHKLRVDCSQDELEKRLLKLANEAQMRMEESGANTLFLALGILEWQDHEATGARKNKRYRSPLLLVPLSLKRRSVRSGFRLSSIDEETRINVTLLEKLKRDFAIDVPGVNPPPEDGSGVDVNLVIQRFRAAVLEAKGFHVREEAYVGIFQFTKFLLWKDLMDRLADLRTNPVVAHLIDTPRQFFEPPTDLKSPIEPQHLDESLHPSDNYCILDADSSQLSAVASAIAGLSFIMVGPPGTGKSQTISNIIATLIAMGKTVLFVAEKRAALEVVQHRLEKVGLGACLLEVHSNKSGKAEILEQFRAAIDFNLQNQEEDWDYHATSLQALRDELNQTVRALHSRLPNGYSAYRCYGILLGHSDAIPRLELDALPSHTAEDLVQLRRLVQDLAQTYASLPPSAFSALAAVQSQEWKPTWEQQVSEALKAFLDCTIEMTQAHDAASEGLGYLIAPLGSTVLPLLARLLLQCANPPAVPSAFVLTQDTSKLETTCQDGLRAYADWHRMSQLWQSWDLESLLAAVEPAITWTGLSHREWDSVSSKFAAWQTEVTALPINNLSPGYLPRSDIRYGPPQEQAQIAAVRIIHKHGQRLRKAIEALADDFGLQIDSLTWASLTPLSALLNHLLTTPSLSATTVRQSSAVLQSISRESFKAWDERAAVALSLNTWNLSAILKLDLPAMQTEWNRASASWIVVRWFKQGMLRKRLRAMAATSAQKIRIDYVPTLLEHINRFQQVEYALLEADAQMRAHFTAHWSRHNYDRDALEASLRWHYDFHVLLKEATETPGLDYGLDSELAAIWEQGAEVFHDPAPLGRRIVEFLQAWQAYQECLPLLETAFHLKLDPDCPHALAPILRFISEDSIRHAHHHLQLARALRTHLQHLDENNQKLFGRTWEKGQNEPRLLDEALAWHRDFEFHAHKFAAAAPSVEAGMRHVLARIVPERPTVLASGGPLLNSFRAFSQAVERYNAAWDRVTTLLEIAPIDWQNALPTERVTLARGILDARAHLRPWCRYVYHRNQMIARQLAPVLTPLDSREIQAQTLPECFDLAYAQASLNYLIDNDAILREFFKSEQLRRIHEFKKLDTRMIELAARMVQAKVSAQKPRMKDFRNQDSTVGEVGVLNHQLSRRRGHLAIRGLFGKIPTILPKLKPCLLMSPLSVAQYLDAAHPKFDVVVFDEASQVRVCDAIGAMARAKQVIVTGDPKQLPPTSFFQKTADTPEPETDEDAPDIADTAESILDECDAAGLPKINLRWHYRSRYESLIAFSNNLYYGNRLLTNPEPAVNDLGVRFCFVDGVYDRGGSKTNLREAEAIVEAIRDHYLHGRNRQQSLGIVTFNSEQRNLIEDLLNSARQADEALDTALSEEADEPLFLKNLENVQGDERDVIFFSIAYGKDAVGRMTQNFGPINKPGGERRLNVAVTRAREGIFVFASIKAADINLANTSATGVRHLKAYLEFAEKGRNSLPAMISKEQTDKYDSEFERKVAEALRTQGWTVHTQIGCSDYRIDMAVVHPDHPGVYVLGIECDGATYHSSATARDRDRLRQAVLERLGWRIHRIWSTDWFHATGAEKDALFVEVRKAIVDYKAVPEESRATIQPIPRPAAAEPKSTPLAPPVRITHAVLPPPKQVAAYQNNCVDGQSTYEAYAEADHTLAEINPYDVDSEKRLRALIYSIIEAESPISLQTLATRVMEHIGMRRATTGLKERIQQLISRRVVRTQAHDTIFYWSATHGPANYTEFRVDGNFRRALEDICPEEQANAMASVVLTYHSVPEEDLLRETSALFGYRSLTRKMRSFLQPGLALLKRKAGINFQSGSYILIKP